MCLFRIFQRNQKVIPEIHAKHVREDYLQFVYELQEYKEFMEHTFPKKLDYSTVIQLYRHDYNMRSTYIASIKALYNRIKINYLCETPDAHIYYMLAKTKYKPLYDKINNMFYNKLLVTHIYKNLYVDESLMHNSSLINLFNGKNQPHIIKPNNIENVSSSLTSITNVTHVI